MTLRDTLYSKIKRPKGLLLLLNGILIVGKIFRNVDQGGNRGLLTSQGNSSSLPALKRKAVGRSENPGQVLIRWG